MIKKLNIELIIYIIWFLFLICIYYLTNFIDGGNFTGGYKLGNDSSRYINSAYNLILGILPEGKANSYFSYNLFLAFCFYIKIGLMGSVILQIILTGIAGYCLYKIAQELYSTNVGRLTLLIFLLFPHIQLRNFYILTESLYISLAIIGIFFISRDDSKKIIFGSLILIFTSFIRPNSIILIFIIFVKIFYMIYKLEKKYFLYISILISTILLLPIFYFIENLLQNENILKYLIKGTVIQEYDGIRVNPLVSNLDKNFDNIYLQLIYILFSNPIYFIEIIYVKLYWALLRYRPYYSDLHNYFIFITTIPIYIFFLFGLFAKVNKNQFLKTLTLLFISLNLIVIIFTFVDWSGRFILPILPFIFIYSSSGIINFLKIIFFNQKNKL